MSRSDAPSPIRVGTAGLPSGLARPKYFERLALLETDQTFIEPPREAALKRWRAELPAGCAFTVQAWQLISHEPGSTAYARMTAPPIGEALRQAGHFKTTPLVRDAWTRTLAAAKTLGAEAIILTSPPSFAPSSANQDALRRFVGEIIGDAPAGIRLVWDPRGVWEPGQATKLGNELGLLVAVDPLVEDARPPEGDEAYFRVLGIGSPRQRLGDEALEVLAELATAYERAWLVLANAEKFRDAQRLRKLVASLAADSDDADSDDDLDDETDAETDDDGTDDDGSDDDADGTDDDGSDDDADDSDDDATATNDKA